MNEAYINIMEQEKQLQLHITKWTNPELTGESVR